MTDEINPTIIADECNVTFIDKKNNIFWPSWKKYSDCSDEEKSKINLRSILPDEVLLDVDLDKNLLEGKTEIEQQVLVTEKYDSIIKRLKAEDIFYYSYKSNFGYHIHLIFDNLHKQKLEVRNEIRKILIKEFNCDISKSSEITLISIPNRPHFKSLIVVSELPSNPGTNSLSNIIINKAKANLSKSDKRKQENDISFKNYHNEDIFFHHIKNNVISDNMMRNNIIFPNIAIALVKEGLNESEIKKIMEPIINKNFPGKNYNEFYGWVKKAMNGEITTYNLQQINKWVEEYDAGFKPYDLAPIQVDLEESQVYLEHQNQEIPGLNVLWDKDLDELENCKTEWVIENWIPKSDICFIAGKAASFKTTICLHLGYGVAMGKQVFNKYNTNQSRVLYVNEENNNNIIMNMIKRVRRGYDLEENDKNEKIGFCMLQNLRLDKKADVEKIVNFINKNNIKVVFFDSFRRFIGFDENKATEMNMLFNNLKELRNKCEGLTIIILHHLKKESQDSDIRDSLRGSSDIVNSADSVIGVKRKHGQDIFMFEHIKSRAMPESLGTMIKIDKGEKGDFAYFYEVDAEANKDKVLPKYEICADDIVKHLKENNIEVFKREDLKEISENYKYDTVTKAIRELKSDGIIVDGGVGGKYHSYVFVDSDNLVEKKAKKEDNVSKDESQTKLKK